MAAQPARQVETSPKALPTSARPRAANANEVSAPKTQAASISALNRRGGSDQDPRLKLIEPSWILLAPVIGAAALLTGLATKALPDPLTAVMLVIAVAMAALTPLAVRFERHRLETAAHRYAFALVVVSLPMALFGTAMTRWTLVANANWQDTLGLIVIASTLAIIILNRRVSSMTAAQLGLWGAIALLTGNTATYFTLAIGGAIGLYAARHEAQSDAQNAAAARERRRTQLRAEEILNDFEQTGQGWFWETDRRGILVYISATIGALLECDASRLHGRPLSELFIPDPQGQESERTLTFHLTARSAFSELALRAATKGEERWWSVNGRPLYDNFGNFLGFRGSGNDLTERRRSAENSTRLAHYDSLTGLANRLQMAQTLENILVALNMEHRTCAVFLLDLDRFKQVDDTMGHPAGDYLLTQVASRLERTIGEQGRVGRLGGDEFQVVLPGRHRREDLAQLALRFIQDVSEPYSIDGHRVMIGASVGIAFSPEDGVTSEALIRNADLALYAAKDGGRGLYHFYAEDLHSDAEERRQLEQDLRDAIVTGGFEVHYQPVVNTSTERITGFEALLRWHHPTRGPMSPAKFIPIAEDSGLIAQIGEWVLRQACQDLAKWPESVRVAVNVSPLQFAIRQCPRSLRTRLLQHRSIRHGLNSKSPKASSSTTTRGPTPCSQP